MGIKTEAWGGLERRAVWSLVGGASSISSATAALHWAAGAARLSEKRRKISALGKCSWVYA